MPSPSNRYDPTRAVEAARAVPKSRIKEYEAYWRLLRRTMTPEGVHQRFLYALASVNNGVSGHLLCYRYFLTHPPGFSRRLTERQFVARFRRVGVGGQFTVRGGGVWRFDRDFTADPTAWLPQRPTPADRDAFMGRLHGLGKAKTAFALELIDPLRCTAVCLDRHALRLYNLADPAGAGKATDGQYDEAEAHWAGLARARGTSPFVLRSVWWDARFGQRNCRWWSYVFESWFAPYAWAAGFGKSRW